MEMNDTIKVFISYRWNESRELSTDLDYELGKDYDCFLDREDLHSNEPLSDFLRQKIKASDCLIALLTNHSLDRLDMFAEATSNQNQDYVFLELQTAFENRISVIPVCLDAFSSNEAQMCFEERLTNWYHRFGCRTTSSIIYFTPDTPSQSRAGFFKSIRSRLNKNKSLKYRDFSHCYWVGTRKSDMPVFPKDQKNRAFAGSISLFGDQSNDTNLVMCPSDNPRRVDHNDPTDEEQDKFIIDSISTIIDKDPNATFLFYNQTNVSRLALKEIFSQEEKFPFVNEPDILKTINNKMSFREMMLGVSNGETGFSFIPVLERTRVDCGYTDLLKAYRDGVFCAENAPALPDGNPSFIVQAPIASGGDGTFVLTKDNERIVLSSLDRNSKYLISVYYEKNIPVNCHAIIYEKAILLSPGSVQLIRFVEKENKLLYKGADFIAYRKINRVAQNDFYRQAKSVATELQKVGYRGVCGIDAIICGEKAYLMEVNGRFQASTELINRALLSRGEKTIQELHADAFENPLPERRTIEEVFVPYSNYTYSYEGAGFHDAHVFHVATESESPHVVTVQTDGYTGNYTGKIPEAYLYRVIFNKNISSINEDGGLWINENIVTPDRWLSDKIRSRERLAVKLALLIQGILIECDLKNELREATNNAVDLQIEDMVVNAPTNIRFVEFSPFSLGRSVQFSGKCRLNYYGQPLIDGVDVFLKDELQDRPLKSGRYISDVAYLSTDRLRVHATNVCKYKVAHRPGDNYGDSCKFCNIRPGKKEITPEDLKETVAEYIKKRDEQKEKNEKMPQGQQQVLMRHFLIGGQSLADQEERLTEFARILGEYHLPIYVMTLPLSCETIKQMIRAGVYEFAFNIEIFDDVCRKKYMPGKSEIPVNTYLERLRDASDLLNIYAPNYARKAVRSMVIVGLEPRKSMLQGIETLIREGVEPILSVFRPLPNTELEDKNAPPIRDVYTLFETISRRMYEVSPLKDVGKFRKLGPSCPYCQNNTVSLPWKYQRAELQKERQYQVDAPAFFALNQKGDHES